MAQGLSRNNAVIIGGYSDRKIYDATALITAASAATDIFTITGALGVRANILHISVTGTQTTASIIDVFMVKRSSANSGGTSTTATAVPIDSAQAAASCTVRSYTANPTLGTLVGNIQIDKLFVSDNATNKGTDETPFLGSERNGIPLAVVRNGEVVAINLNGATVAGNSFACHIRWEEVPA